VPPLHRGPAADADLGVRARRIGTHAPTLAAEGDGYDGRAGAVAEWLGRGLQSLVHQFDSGRRLSFPALIRLEHPPHELFDLQMPVNVHRRRHGGVTGEAQRECQVPAVGAQKLGDAVCGSSCMGTCAAEGLRNERANHRCIVEGCIGRSE
jgi:hypothetical protein